MHLRLLAAFCYLFLTLPLSAWAQTASLSGTIQDASGAPLPLATVLIPSLKTGTAADESGTYRLANLPAGTHEVVVSLVGYRTFRQTITLAPEQNATATFSLAEDLLSLDQIVVTATRGEIPAFDAPVIVSRISNKTFQATQSLTLSEGLSFSPGLRLENNCQNCGFTQVRMNGLDGPYSQILINSRPIYSALTGVYGLEMLPANMIERVEVVRGGGSVLYGGNAIAGTINVITLDPSTNSFEIGSQMAYLDNRSPDHTLSFNGSLVTDDLNKGVSFYGFNRNRKPLDLNGDDISEVALMENTTFGMDAFWKTSERGKLKANLFNINEFRRGGSHFDRPPHQTDITEQVKHRILGGGLSFEQFSADARHKISLYASGQGTVRDSYYGGGGRILQPGDELTEEDLLAINAYGRATDLTMATGAQYTFNSGNNWILTVGSEYQHSDVQDEMPGYGRKIDQQAGVLGNYAQLELMPTERLSFLLGGRLDHVRINGLYDLAAESFRNERTLTVAVPRLTAMYNLSDELKLRASFAQGYRAPQVFDEDLHIETVGGAARFTRLDPDLVTERSNSFNASVNYARSVGNMQFNFVLEGFHTRLLNPFITASQEELPSGIAVVTKRNGDGAIVQGTNLEANMAWGSKWMLQAGLTVQSARYVADEEIWAPEVLNEANADSVITTRNMLRTPPVYGFYSLTYTPNKRLSVSYNAVVTGRMDVAHVIDPETEFTIIRRTPAFFENNFKVAYTVPFGKGSRVEIFAGAYNLFNSFQRDFDFGPERDAGYVYGPGRPRTLFAGLKFGIN